MSSNRDNEAGIDLDGGVYRTSAGLPCAFLGRADDAGSRRTVALALLLSATASAMTVVLLGLLFTHPAGEVQVARTTEIVP